MAFKNLVMALLSLNKIVSIYFIDFYLLVFFERDFFDSSEVMIKTILNTNFQKISLKWISGAVFIIIQDVITASYDSSLLNFTLIFTR